MAGPNADKASMSPLCAQELHEDCPHWTGGEVRLFGRKANRSRDRLCQCACHSGCPVTAEARGGTAPSGVWRGHCTCAGAQSLLARPGRDDVADAAPRGGNLLGRLGLLAQAGVQLRRGYNSQDVTADSPDVVMLDDTSSALLERAMDLAADGREDEEAVSELSRMARGDRSLKIAALGARQWGQHHDYPVPNLAHRLLQAAIVGGPVAPVDPSDAERFEVLLAFDELGREGQWAELVRRDPGLASVETEIESHASPSDWGSRYLAVADRVKQLVGPQSGSADILLSSHAAMEAAIRYLAPPT